MTGTHCDPETAQTGLTEEREGLLDRVLYEEDCESIGVRPRPNQPFTEEEEKLDDLPADSVYADQDMKDMDIRLADMAFYQGDETQLLDDIVDVSMFTYIY